MDSLRFKVGATLALSQALRRKYLLDRPGAQMEITEREDGVLELRSTVPIPSQAWFWTQEWQAKEGEADENFANGEVVEFAHADEFLASLAAMDKEGDEK